MGQGLGVGGRPSGTSALGGGCLEAVHRLQNLVGRTHSPSVVLPVSQITSSSPKEGSGCLEDISKHFLH